MGSSANTPDAYREPTAEEIAAGYREFTGGAVDLWHFVMMNDEVRNSAFEAALKSSLKNGGVVLDIGTGSGLLAMMAVRQGASHVITCEAIPQIARKATEIIKSNGFADRIQVINKRSTDLVAGQDFLERADVLVTETFDDGLLGEAAFASISHAREHLLKPEAQIIPIGAKVTVVAIESQEIFQNHRVTQASGFDVSAFNEFTMDGYMGYHLDKVKYEEVSARVPIFNFDFKKIPSAQTVPFEFIASKDGVFHAMAFWYELNLNPEVSINTGAGLSQLSCWKQAIQLFDRPLKLKKGERVQMIAHHSMTEIWFEPNDQ